MSNYALKTVWRTENTYNRLAGDALRRRGWTNTVKAYTGYGTTRWIRVLCRVLLGSPEPGDVGTATLARGWRNFTSVPVRDVEVTIEAGDRRFRVCTDRSGLIDERLEVSLEPGWHDVTILAPGAAPATAGVRVISDEPQVAMVSDIDDTVLVTSLPRPMIAAWNTLVLNEHARRPVPGMAVLYERIIRHYENPAVFYLSTGAWNVAPTLTRFLSRNMYPAGPLLLTDWGPMEDRWFRSGMDHKVRTLRRLADELPNVKFLLVGDDGQHDPEIYSGFAREFPGRTEGIAIRRLSPTEQVLASGSTRDRSGKLTDVHVPWLSAPNGAGLAEALESRGLLTRLPGDRQEFEVQEA